MKTIIYLFFFFFILNVEAQNSVNQIRGNVTNSGKPLSNVNVLIKGTSIGVQTNSKGAYSIKAKPKDVLIFSYVGMQTLELMVEDHTSIMDAELLPKVELLDEVTVKKKRPFTQKELLIAYPKNKSLIKTSRGILDKDRASFSLRVIDGKELIPVGTDFLYSLQNLYPQMKVIRECEPIDPICPKVILQKWSSGARPTAIFDVDGFIYEKPPTFIQVNDIERVAIMVRNGAISRYGPQGIGGVIIINTKSKTWMDDISIKRTYDNSGLRDSLILALNTIDKYAPDFPNYLKKFDAATSMGKALKIFDDLKKEYGDTPYYFIEVSDFFNRRWKNREKAGELLDVLQRDFPQDVAALRASAYKYEILGQYGKTLKTYLKILSLNSRAAQSFRDVANTYNELGNYRKALAFYTRYEKAINELDSIPFDANGTDILMTTEVSNILKMNEEQLSKKKNTIEEAMVTSSTRLVFEWNNDQAEFELQFIDSDDSTFNWKKTKNETDELFQNQVQKGYSTKQLFFEDELNAQWKVNINYLGNGSNFPTYLKVTSFFDYGKPSQKKEIKLFRLSNENQNVHLFTMDIGLKQILN
ncbi:carboxypeptidase-like regulatory domain-containing protein [Maribacter sp. HTCC2170]|uniref:carboxypeptidase-like regulatory domain-containing protein n=1 Tax=Maribacter sp. (strain HTCC2170 / KCCM 42371) TaxID=313603 RepID=UPI00006B222F|nr:carboxypeptidase-like regulatory domain-containing protein [Maribacter sp. HTCC2170]EAR00305.1 putative TonB-dependent outer membrane exported protein [Maribacter sp. HTCC2170]